jgi:hypothetical protein
MTVWGLTEGAYWGTRVLRLLVKITAEKLRNRAPANAWLNMRSAMATGIWAGGKLF